MSSSIPSSSTGDGKEELERPVTKSYQPPTKSDIEGGSSKVGNQKHRMDCQQITVKHTHFSLRGQSILCMGCQKITVKQT